MPLWISHTGVVGKPWRIFSGLLLALRVLLKARTGVLGLTMLLTVLADAMLRAQTSNQNSGSFFSISGMSLNLDLRYAPSPGDALIVLNNTNTSTIDGAYSNLPDGGTLSSTYNGTTYTFVANYKSGAYGNSLTLTYKSDDQAK